MSYPLRSLYDVCTITMGQSPESKTYNYEGNGLPFFQGTADFGLVYPQNRMYCSKPKKTAHAYDILLSVRAPVGSVNITKEKCCIGRGLAAISGRKDIAFNKYIFYFLMRFGFKLADLQVGSTFGAVSKKDIESLKVPLPPIETQKKIAEVLDKAQELIDKRKEQIALLDDFIQSVFIDMFGDPVSNPNKWEIRPFEYFAQIDTKMTKDFKSCSELPHIGIENIEKNTGKLINYQLVKEQKLLSGKYLFGEEHIIYSKIRPNLNKVALPNFRGLCSADAYPLLVKKSNTNRYYFAYILRSKYFLDYILKFCSRTNIPKVNKEQLKGFGCICPPLDLQNQFAQIVEKTEEQRELLEKSLTEMEKNFNSLMQRAFRGELF